MDSDKQEGDRVTPDAVRFASLSDGDSQLLNMAIERAVTAAVAATMAAYTANTCAGHDERTDKLESWAFGRPHEGASGASERLATLERAIEDWQDDRRWTKRAVIGAVIAACSSVAVSLLLLLADGII